MLKKFIIKRLLTLPLILFILSGLIFSLVAFLSPYERLAVFIPDPEVYAQAPVEELVILYGLDEAIHIQYLNWLKNVFLGDLGWSPSARMPVSRALSSRFPATVELMLLGQLVIFFGGIAIGTYTAKNHNKLGDHFFRFMTTLGIAFPGFVVGLLLLVIFYSWLGWFPPGRLSPWAMDVVGSLEFQRYTGMNTLDGILNGRFDVFLNSLRHMILPAFAYSLSTLAATIRLMRSSLLETLRKDYIYTARSKGLSEKVVVNKHARRNALLPVITFMGTSVPIMFGGAVIIETVFGYPGMGLFIVQAAHGLDFPAILGSDLLVGVVIVFVNLVVDLLYRILDPTIRYD